MKPQVDILAEEIRRLDRVVKTFLDFTRPAEIHPADAEIAPLVREVFALAEPQARKNNVHLILAGNGATPPLRVDRDLIKQALLNLVLNGCQAMPQGGELTITPHATPHAVELEIRDTGVGIPPMRRRKSFRSFTPPSPEAPAWGSPWRFASCNSTTAPSNSPAKSTAARHFASPCPPAPNKIPSQHSATSSTDPPRLLLLNPLPGSIRLLAQIRSTPGADRCPCPSPPFTRISKS